MTSQKAPFHLRRHALKLALFCAGVLPACGAGDRDAVLTKRGPTLVGQPDVSVGPVASKDRFPMGGMTGSASGSMAQGQNPAHDPHATPSLVYDLPATWKSLPKTSIRILNFQVQDDERATCYLATLEGPESAVLDNVNRWRRQFGLEPLDPTSFAALPKQILFDRPGVRVTCEGEFDDGMGGAAIPDAALLGVILHEQGTLVFLKMVGPKSILATEGPNFDRFCASLELPSVQAAPSGAVAGDSNSERALLHAAPAAWRLQGPRPMRKLGFDVGTDCDLSVTVLGGAAGGVTLNLNRWRDQLNLPGIGEESLGSLPRITALGQEGYWIDLTGSYKGMGDQIQIEAARLLGAIVPLSDQMLFVKLVGSLDQVAAEEANLRAFVQSLRWEEEQ